MGKASNAINEYLKHPPSKETFITHAEELLYILNEFLDEIEESPIFMDEENNENYEANERIFEYYKKEKEDLENVLNEIKEF